MSNADFQAALTAGSTSANVADLYYYTFASKNLNLPLDSVKLAKSLKDALRADASIIK